MQVKEEIIFFDGVCGLCNGFVDFILSIDKNEMFKFSPIQSHYAKSHLPIELTQNIDSIIVQVKGMTYIKSKAVMKIFKELGGFWGLLSYGSLFPISFTDLAYDLVAKNRYLIFGKKETCRIPTPGERERFIL